MSIPSIRLVALFLALALASAGSANAQTSPTPPLPDDVVLRELVRDGQTVWLYLPKGRQPSGLVVVPPSNGTLVTAPPLGGLDRPEHTPYAQAGFAVVSFSLSGEISGEVKLAEVRTAMADFVKARAGVKDAQHAIAAALAEVPALSSGPIFAAGHSSAANLALALTADDTRVKAVIAYAPVADAPKFISGSPLFAKLAGEVPGALELVRELTPLALTPKLRVPVMIFHAQDDDVAPIEGTRELARRLESAGNAPNLVTPAKGGHADVLLTEGVPAGVAWLSEQRTRR